MASEVDTSVGIILKHLEMEDQLNNTLVIFTTDNGNFHAEHGLADKWYPHQERCVRLIYLEFVSLSCALASAESSNLR